MAWYLWVYFIGALWGLSIMLHTVYQKGWYLETIKGDSRFIRAANRLWWSFIGIISIAFATILWPVTVFGKYFGTY
jgi:hypothetical protein